MTYTYAILGAGRQGTAAAYDMACWGDAARVILADADLNAAQASADRVNRLSGRPAAEAAQLDVTDIDAVEGLLRNADACLSAVPYYYNLAVTHAALRAGAHVCDLGGHTGIARQQHQLDARARAAGLSIIPNCGQVPGMGTTLMVYAMELLDEATDVTMWDGGLPQRPRPPFHYLLTFNVAGLTNEYAEPAVYLREGRIVEVEPLSELEEVDFPEPIGRLEAFTTGGGTDTMPWTYQDKLRTLENKTLRYPGHYAQLRAFYDLGLWSLEPIQVPGGIADIAGSGGVHDPGTALDGAGSGRVHDPADPTQQAGSPPGTVEVVPRDLFHALFEPKVTFPEDKDLIVVRVKAVGKKDGRDAEAVVELIDYYDEATGFTAMERCTGWSAAIVAEMMVRGDTPRGSGGVEIMVPARAYVHELARRGIGVREQITS